MRIYEILGEGQQSLWQDEVWPSEIGPRKKSYDKLNAFRKFKSGPDQVPARDFGDDEVHIDNASPNNHIQFQKQNAPRTAATTTKIPDIAIKGNGMLRKTPEEQQQHLDRVRQLYSIIGTQAIEHNKQPLYAYYGDDTFGCSVKTDNGIKIGTGPLKGPTGQLGYFFDNIPEDGFDVIKEMMVDAGYTFSASAQTKLRFIPPTQDLTSIADDFWSIINRVEELGADFKSKITPAGASSGVGNGAGSLITGKQAPYQYYKWLASNIYESVKNNTSWGFSRGGSDSGGAYDRYDHHIIIGITKGGLEQKAAGREPYREHIVPCDLINRMAIDICKRSPKGNAHRNQVIMEVAKMIHRNLAIVLCSSNPESGPDRDRANDGDREKIDFDNGLKTTMPPGWKDGDSILARFSYCDIPVYRNIKNHPSNGKRLTETGDWE
jgi:hypothetical protein